MGALPAGVTAEMVQQGQQLFGTVCVACHGQAGAGTQLGPALNDAEWINVTAGEIDEVVNVIRTGVAQPRQFPNPMPPMGGGNFTDEQLRALAAYVYSISHAG
jgi:mono/diheme cytochrome c family protein